MRARWRGTNNKVENGGPHLKGSKSADENVGDGREPLRWVEFIYTGCGIHAVHSSSSHSLSTTATGTERRAVRLEDDRGGWGGVVRRQVFVHLSGTSACLWLQHESTFGVLPCVGWVETAECAGGGSGAAASRDSALWCGVPHPSLQGVALLAVRLYRCQDRGRMWPQHTNRDSMQGQACDAVYGRCSRALGAVLRVGAVLWTAWEGHSGSVVGQSRAFNS